MKLVIRWPVRSGLLQIEAGDSWLAFALESARVRICTRSGLRGFVCSFGKALAMVEETGCSITTLYSSTAGDNELMLTSAPHTAALAQIRTPLGTSQPHDVSLALLRDVCAWAQVCSGLAPPASTLSIDGSRVTFGNIPLDFDPAERQAVAGLFAAAVAQRPGDDVGRETSLHLPGRRVTLTARPAEDETVTLTVGGVATEHTRTELAMAVLGLERSKR